MNNIPKLSTLLTGATILVSSTLFGSTVTTTPVGYIKKTVNETADLKLSLPFKQASALVSAVDSVSSGVITATTTVPDVTTEAHYIWITSGALEGDWYAVTGYTSSSITVDEDLETLGLAGGHQFEVIPFWTLNKLFPDGAGFVTSASFLAPSAQILTNDVTASGINLAASSSYFFHSGVLPTGWYKSGALGSGLQNDVTLDPGSYLTVRNGTSDPIDITVAGTVPVTSIGNLVVETSSGSQDNQLPNPFPAPVTLGESGLTSVVDVSPSFIAPGDTVLVYDSVPTAINPAPDKAFFYHTGVLPSGWYQSGALGAGIQDNYEIPAGGAIVIRKASGTDQLLVWSPDTPYTLIDETP